MKNIGVIGSGVAGMATAIRLAAAGHNITVYEKNGYPGGKLSHFKAGEYHFDAGPSLFTQPSNVEELFSLTDRNLNDYFTYRKEDVACSYFFENGKTINAYTDRVRFANELREKLGIDPNKVVKYLTDAEKAYQSIGHIFLNKSLHKFSTWFHLETLSALKATKFSYLLSSLHKYNHRNFENPELVQIFDRFATYNGSNPYTAPAMLSMIPHLEQNEGTYYPHGGMISITDALYKLANELGVQFHFNSNIDKIEHTNNKVAGLVSNQKYYKHDFIVSNVDVFYTYKNLLNLPVKARMIERQERSSSAIIFYWGIKKKFDKLGLHNIFFSKDYLEEFNHIFYKKVLSSDNTVYVNITSKIDNNHAPEGCENWFVMVNAPYDNHQNWDKLRESCRESVIRKLSSILHTDISSLIEVEEYLDPTLIDKKTGSYRGSLYGTSSNSKFAAFLRHKNWSDRLRGLYFVGGSVHPGGGIPLCLKSAKITSEIILKNIHK